MNTMITDRRPVPSPSTTDIRLDEAPAEFSDQELLQLRLDGLSVAEVGAIVGKSPSAAARALRRAEATLLAVEADPLWIRFQHITTLQTIRRAKVRAMRLDDEDCNPDPRDIKAVIELTRREAEVVGSDAPPGPRSIGADPASLIDPEDLGGQEDPEMRFALEIQDLIQLTDRLITAGVAPGVIDELKAKSEPGTPLMDLLRDRQALPSAAVDQSLLPEVSGRVRRRQEREQWSRV